MNLDGPSERRADLRNATVPPPAGSPGAPGLPGAAASSGAVGMDAALPDVALPTAGLSRSGADGSVVAGVDAELDTLAQLPLAQHADVFERLHRGLRDSLADIDDA